MVDKHKLMPLFLASFLMLSCSDDNDASSNGDKDYPLSIAGKIYDYGASDAETLTHEEHIGIYVLKASEVPVTERANMGYKATYGSRDDFFQPDNTEQIFYFPTEGEEKWDVHAYYPYQDDFNGQYPLSTSDQSKLDPDKLLCYAQYEGLWRDNRTANLHFTPVLSKVVFRFYAGSGMTAEQITDITATLRNVHTSGYLDVLTSRVETEEDSRKDMAMTVSEDVSLPTRYLYIMPCSDTHGYTLEFTIEGEEVPRKYNISDDVLSFGKGKQYVFDVTVNLYTIDVDAHDAPIEGWENDGTTGVVGEEDN